MKEKIDDILSPIPDFEWYEIFPISAIFIIIASFILTIIKIIKIFKKLTNAISIC